MDGFTRDPETAGGAIGKSPARLMARRAVEGRARHVDDLTLPRTVDVAYVRSPFAHAEIGEIGDVPHFLDGQPSRRHVHADPAP